jgi:hypothetical protein
MQSLPQEMQDDLNAYLYLDVAKDKGIPSLEDLRNDILGKHPELAHNMIFTQVFFKTKNGENVIEFNTRTKGNKGFTGTLINEMRRLFNSPAKPLIVATLKHLLAKNSLQFRNDSPISIIGPQLLEEVFKVEGVTMSNRTDEYTPILNQKDDAAYKRIFGLSRIELLEEFQEYFMRDINNNAYVTYVKEEVFRKDKEDAKSFTPVSETDAGFKVDVDAHLGYNSPLNMFEEGEYSETGDYLGSTEDKSSKELQRRRNRAIFNLFGFEKIIEYYEKKTEDPATKQVTIKKGKTVVYAFPRFIKVGKQLYRLKSYVPLDKRFAKEDKFSSTPNEEGKYIGTAVEYEPVTRWGGNGATPYGRTKAQNEAKNFEATDAARKSAKLESKESAAEDANDYVGEDEVVDNQPLLQSTLQPTTSLPQDQPTPTKQDQLVQKNMATLVATSVTTSDALSANKDALKAEAINASVLKPIKDKQGKTIGITSDLKQKLNSLVFKSDPIVIKFLTSNPGVLSAVDATPDKIKDTFLKFVDTLTNEEAVQLRKALCS